MRKIWLAVTHNGIVNYMPLSADTPLPINALLGAEYTLTDKQTGKSITPSSLVKVDEDLRVFVDDELTVTIEGFYTEGASNSFNPTPSTLVSTISATADGIVWEHEYAAKDSSSGVNSSILGVTAAAVGARPS